MPITPETLKEFGIKFAVAESDEVELRAAISRAYYAAFHTCLPFVSQLPESAKFPKNAKHVTHQEMSDRLREWKTAGLHPKLASMAAQKGALWRTIDAARDVRIKADYRLDDQLLLADAQTQIERVKQILRLMHQVETLLAADDVAPAEAANE